MFPPVHVRVRPENLLLLKNNDYERLLVKNLMWYSSLIDDLRLISIDASTGDEDADARLLHDVNLLILRAEQERAEIESMIHKAYKVTSPTDTLALNSVRRHRQDRMVGWQQDFDRLPKPRQLLLSEKDKRTMTFGSVRNMFPKRSELVGLFDPFPPGRDSDGESIFFPRRIVSDPATSASESEQIETLRAKNISQEARRTLNEMSSLDAQEQVIGSLGKGIVALPPVDEVTKSETEGDVDSDVTIEALAGPAQVQEKSEAQAVCVHF
jgi:1-phosphatidylinositol-3-phosphate 5-kinase